MNSISYQKPLNSVQKIKLKKPEFSFKMQEEIKTLRANITFAGKNKKVIAVTSTMAGEGKSSTAIKLAGSLAELGHKVVLLDADLRASVLLGMLEENVQVKGLSYYLSGQARLPEVIYTSDVKNLDLILSGPVPPNPTELLSSVEFSDMVTQLREQYDYVIIDTPPLGIVIDAAIIGRYSDTSILVIRSASIKYKMVQEVKKQMEDAGCPILGVVLNRVNKKDSSGYYGRYGQYGNYQKENR